jgi:two-component system, NtrC family, response regulator HydG
MANHSLNDLTPSFFLQTFIIELMHASEQIGHEHAQQLIENIACTAGHFFEELYRYDLQDQETRLDTESYTDLILGLKNNIGGNFSLVSASPDGVVVNNTRCPFGDKVTAFPELCRMTSSVFGGIAARNFGYAKVEISKSIARQDGCCEVYVHLNEDKAKHKSGIEYRDENNNALSLKQDVTALQARIEESMLRIWRRDSKPSARKTPPLIVANSVAMKKVLQVIEVVAPSTATVLIHGPTGVGKELAARAIHAMSDRSAKIFMPVNCGAIADSLIESALFGHEKGAFTGAVEVHQGVFERAEGGSLFLDEVDSLSPAAQTRLLRVLQEGELERVGGKQTIHVNVRIIAATNVQLEQKVAQGLFRNDLYYRINVIKLMIPALANRPEDLSPLVQLILRKMNQKHGKQVSGVSREVMRKILGYAWPGNVRQLENALERSVLFCQSETLTELLLDDEHDAHTDEDWRQLKEQALGVVEEKYLRVALLKYQGDVTRIADSMGLSTRAVYGKLKKYALRADQYR